MVDPPVIWVVVDGDGRARYIADEGDAEVYPVGPALSEELRKCGATLVRYAPTPRAEQ